MKPLNHTDHLGSIRLATDQNNADLIPPLGWDFGLIDKDGNCYSKPQIGGKKMKVHYTSGGPHQKMKGMKMVSGLIYTEFQKSLGVMS